MGQIESRSKIAAMYVRMSTDHQQYSIVNQADAIERYAAEHGLTIVKKFIDSGKSGLTLAGRPALQQLLSEVISMKAGFNHLLVYDVSRWGRFQDADESAYYEYSCKKANVRLHYCFEPFFNDGTAYSSLIKALKRTMAGEYSRELSVKIHASQARLAAMGFHQGGNAGYGLRRLLVEPNGTPKGWLEGGQRKNLHEDRVLLVPGPSQEIAVVQQIFNWYTIENRSMEEIARILNQRNTKAERCMRYPNHTLWTRRRVRRILTSPKYIGTSIYNRTSTKLSTPVVKNPMDQWIRHEAAIKPLVDRDLFMKAQKTRQSRNTFPSDYDILDQLRDLLKRTGRLSGRVINKDRRTVGTTSVTRKFKSLSAVFELIGYKPTWDYEGIAKRRQERTRTTGIHCLRESILAALASGTLSETFTVAEFRSACPGWSFDSYSSFCKNCFTRNKERSPIKLRRVGYGRYRVVKVSPFLDEKQTFR